LQKANLLLTGRLFSKQWSVDSGRFVFHVLSLIESDLETAFSPCVFHRKN